MENRTEPGEARELRGLLAAVLEALDIPSPATVGDGEAHDRILLDRVLDARVALACVLRRGDCADWSADYLRARLAEKPATGYRAAGSAGQLHDEGAVPLANADVDDGQDDEERARRSVDRAFPVVAAFLAEERAHVDVTADTAQGGSCPGLGGACVVDHSAPVRNSEDAHCDGPPVTMAGPLGSEFPAVHLSQWTADVPQLVVGDGRELGLADVEQLLSDLRGYEARVLALRAQLAALLGGGK